MNKKELAILEKAFTAEINSALEGGCHLIQSKSKVAEKLESDGYLEKSSITLSGFPPVTITGYQLTHAGRYAYGESCEAPF